VSKQELMSTYAKNSLNHFDYTEIERSVIYHFFVFFIEFFFVTAIFQACLN